MPPDKDVFAGSSSIARFSALLAAGEADGLFDQEVVEVLGEEALEAFRYAQRRLEGSYRKVTGEPVICHSADIALRARDLGYGSDTVCLCLLHDVAEDLGGSLEQVLECLEEIEQRFGPGPAADAALLTNGYSVVLRAVGPGALRDLPPGVPPGRLVARAIQDYRRRLPAPVARRFAGILNRLEQTMAADPGEEDRPHRSRDRAGDPLRRLRQVGYRLYLEDINDAVRDRPPTSERLVHDIPLVVKALDLVDNLRTADVVNLANLENILLKAETFLDCSFFLHRHLHERSLASYSTFIPLYDYVKHSLVEQLSERRAALGALADTRFGLLARYLLDEIVRLRRKYKVLHSPVAELCRLRGRIRALNRCLPGGNGRSEGAREKVARAPSPGRRGLFLRRAMLRPLRFVHLRPRARVAAPELPLPRGTVQRRRPGGTAPTGREPRHVPETGG